MGFLKVSSSQSASNLMQSQTPDVHQLLKKLIDTGLVGFMTLLLVYICDEMFKSE